MKYYRITDDINKEGRWWLGDIYSPSGPVEACMLTSGVWFDSPNSLCVTSQKGRCLDFTMADFDVPIMSSAAALILKKWAPSDVQLIPVTIQEQNSCNSDWYIVNALRTISCIDEQRSIYTKWTIDDKRPDKIGQYRMVPKIVIDPIRICGIQMFRIAGWDVALVVSKELRDRFEKKGVSGAVFQSIT